MSRKPDPHRVNALIIGVSSYDDTRYPNLPSARESANRISALIAGNDMWQLPKENVERLIGKVTTRDAALAIKRATQRDLDALLVYICGHGRRWTDADAPDRHLHFAFSDSDCELPFTHLPFLAVRKMLMDGAKAAAKILIIDCCYAKDAFLSADDLAGPFDVRGVCTLVSTRWNVPALTLWPGTNYTKNKRKQKKKEITNTEQPRIIQT